MNVIDRTIDSIRRFGDRAGGRARLAARGSTGPGWLGASVVGLIAGATGAALAFLLDPARGRARRARLIDQGAATARRAGRHADAAARRVKAGATARVAAFRHDEDTPRPTDDATVTDRVRSEVLGDPALADGAININVERGIVVLRGEVPSSELRSQLVDRVERVDGVWAVRDLLHLPGEPAPTRESVGSA